MGNVEYWQVGRQGPRFINWSLSQVTLYRHDVGLDEEPIYGYNGKQLVCVINTNNYS